MKFQFKIQQYQTDAVDAVVKVFKGQHYANKVSYIRDVGNVKPSPIQTSLFEDNEYSEYDDIGYKNEILELSDEQLLKNINEVQSQNNMKNMKRIWKK